MAKMNDRVRALAAGEVTYAMSKPCKRGHLGKRYSSNGMCVACTDMHGRDRERIQKEARILSNTKKFESSRVFSGLARPSVHTYFSDLCDIFRNGSEAQQLMVAEAIVAVRQGVNIGMPVRSQGELNYDTLRAAVDLSPTRICYVDGSPLDEQQHPEMGLLIRIGQHWYMGSTLKAVWDQVRDVARPVTLGG